MRTKSIIIFSTLILAIALVVGVSFAIWSHDETVTANYTVNAEEPTVLTCIVEDSATKLIPPKGEAAATESSTKIIINVEAGRCDLAFSMTVQMKKPSGEFITVSDDVLSVGIYDGADTITNITALSGEKILYVKAKFVKDMELIDPIFKNAEFKYTITITPTKA